MLAVGVNRTLSADSGNVIVFDKLVTDSSIPKMGIPPSTLLANLVAPRAPDVHKVRLDIPPPQPGFPGVPLFAVGGGAAPPGGGALGAAQPKAVIGINPQLAVDPAMTPVFGMIGPCCVGALAAIGLGGGAAAVMRDRGVVAAAVPLWAAGVAHYVAKAIWLPWQAYAVGVTWLAVNIGLAYWRNRDQRAASAPPASTTAQEGGDGVVKACCKEGAGEDEPLLTLGRIPPEQRPGE